MIQQFIVNGLIAGAIYSLVAVGFSLMFSVTRFANFAHGSTVAVSGYLTYYFFSSNNLPFLLSALLAILGAVLFGLFSEKIIFQSMRSRKSSSVILLIASVALLMLMESLFLLLFGPEVKSVHAVPITEGISIAGAIITPVQLIILGTALLFYLVLTYVMYATQMGKAMRAVSDNREVAEILGVSSNVVYRNTVFFASIIAGIAGVLIAIEQNITPGMGTMLIIKGFTGTIIGGVGSVPGAIVGSFILGLAENLGIMFIPSGFKDAIAFLLLFLFLIFKPEGLGAWLRRDLRKVKHHG